MKDSTHTMVTITYTRHEKTYGLGGFGQSKGHDAATIAGAVKVIADELGVATDAVHYLLDYGYGKSMQDCIAGRAKALKEEILAKAKKEGKAAPKDSAIEAEIATDETARLQKRHDAIVAGEVGTRGPHDTLRALATELVRDKLAEKKMKADKEQFAKFVSDLLTIPEKRKMVQAEYDKRQASKAKLTFDL